MSTQAIIFIIAIVMVLVIAVAWGRGGRLRVTQITRERTTSKKSEQDQ